MEIDTLAPSGLCVFLADDDDDDCLLFKMALQNCKPDCAYYRFENGVALIAAMNGEGLRPDTIFLDLYMPLMDGLEAYAILHAHPEWSHIPTVFLTGSNELEYLCNKYGIDSDFIYTKPRTEQELKAIIYKHISAI